MEEAPDLHIIEYNAGNSEVIDDIEAYETTNSFLARHPEVSAILLPINGAYGVCRAIVNFGRGDIKAVVFDDLPFIREMMKKGIIDAAIYQDAFTQGSFPIRLMYAFLVNKKQPSQ